MEEPKLLGDYTEAMLKKIGADKLVKAYERVTKKPCACSKRRNAMNNIHRAVRGHIQQISRPPVQQHVAPTKPVDEN